MGNWLLHYVPLFNALAAVVIATVQALNFKQTLRVRAVQHRIERSVNGRMSEIISKIPGGDERKSLRVVDEMEGTIDTKQRRFDDEKTSKISPE